MIAADRKTVTVGLGPRSYDILIGSRLLDEAGPLVVPFLVRPKIAVVTDENVARLHLAALKKSFEALHIALHTIILPAGEKTKSYANLAALCDNLLAAGVEREDVVFAFGGGVIGDLAGFAAAVLRRGVACIQCPTTLLAQVDSSVGGKTGINSPHGKNLVGAFHQPRFVLADTSLLATLPDRERAAGYAEIVKYGLLGDRTFFEWLEKNGSALLKGNERALTHAITVSCKAKASIVSDDEREHAGRALLNLGHTFGHALETATGFSDRLLHGEAVAIGMAMAFRFSLALGLCSSEDPERVCRHLTACGLPAKPRDIGGKPIPAGDLLAIMRQDKKSRAGALTLILVRGIGEAFVARDIDERSLLDFLATELS